MTDRYGVIGKPIQQSKSPIIHGAFAAATGHPIHYGRIEGEPGAFGVAVDTFRAAGGRGLNVTSPFKLDAFDYATFRHDRARLAGAANCLMFDGDRVEADNFDGIGLLRDIEVNLAVSLRGKRVLMLGAGGAARGALEPLLSAQPAQFVVSNRTGAKAVALARMFPGVDACELGELDRQDPFDVVVHATSAGLHDQELQIPPTLFRPDSLAYDMTYGQGLTAFLSLARRSGAARIHDGVGMLVEQAAEAFAWWRGVRPVTREVIARIAIPLK